MEKVSWLDKVTNEEVFTRINEDWQILNCIWQRKHRWIGHVLTDITDFCTKLLKAEWEVNWQEEEVEFKCYVIWQMMAIMGSWGQRKIETQIKDVQKPATQQKTTDDVWWNGAVFTSIYALSCCRVGGRWFQAGCIRKRI